MVANIDKKASTLTKKRRLSNLSAAEQRSESALNETEQVSALHNQVQMVLPQIHPGKQADTDEEEEVQRQLQEHRINESTYTFHQGKLTPDPCRPPGRRRGCQAQVRTGARRALQEAEDEGDQEAEAVQPLLRQPLQQRQKNWVGAALIIALHNGNVASAMKNFGSIDGKSKWAAGKV